MEKLYFLLWGVGCAAFGACLLWRRLDLFLNGERTPGRVVGWEPRGRRVFFHPVVAFTAVDGAQYQITSYAGYSVKPEIESFPVIYLSRRPAKALVYSALHFWAAPLMLLAMAAAPLFLFFRQ